MKTDLKSLAGGVVFALAAVIGSTAFAGPGPQYWQQQEKLRAENATKAKATAVAEKPAMACLACRTTPVHEFSAKNVSGKYAPQFIPIGSKHDCSACGGTITTTRGQTASDMKDNCPICAKAKANGAACCATR